MKRIYLLIAAGLFCALAMQAQRRVVAKLGFEDGDDVYTTPYSLTALVDRPSWWADNTNVNGPDVGFYYGDWVNYKEGDEWNEKCDYFPHSGEYCFVADNNGSKQNPWDRGFKIGLEGVKEETPYRVSFWVKVDPTDKNGDLTVMTSWFSQGVEELDKSIPNYGFQENKELMSGETMDYTGDWQRIVYQVFVCKREVIDATVQSYQGTKIFPFEGGDGQTYWQFFGERFPDMYFFIANMFSPATYYLDDILVEENVTVKDVSYSSEIIKIDFGYANNIANLAKANSGTISLDETCVTVTQDGEDVPVDYVEGKSDGFLYVFVGEELYEDSEVIVNFKGDSKLIYTSALRPTADTGDNVAVLGFEDEPAVWDEDVYAEALAYGTPTVKRSVPVNGSFNLLAEDVKEISLTFTSKVNISKAKATLQNSKAKKDFTAVMSLDGTTLTVPVTAEDLADGVNVFTVEGLQNETLTEKNIKAEISFEVGEAQGDGSSLVVYQTDWTSLSMSDLPIGFYGESDNGNRKSTYFKPYNGGGAPRLSAGDVTGDNINKNVGLYWGARGGSKGTVSFGQYAAQTAAEDYDGELPAFDKEDPDQESIDPDKEALYLSAGAYTLDFRNAAWDGANGNKFAVRIANYAWDEDDEVYKKNAIFEEKEITPAVTVNNVTPGGNATPDPDVNIPLSHYEFEVETPGYYFVEFEGNTGWSCWLLTYLQIASKPESESAYWTKLLNDEINTASELLNTTDERYDGTAKNALAETIEEAQKGRFTNGEEVDAMVKKLQAAENALATRKANYNNFVKKCGDAQTQIAGLDGKYATNPKVKDAEAILAKYDGVNPTNLTDDELAAASADVDAIPGILSNIKQIVDYLTERAIMAADLGDKLLIEEAVVDRLRALSADETDVINDANKFTTLALYQWLAEGIDIYDEVELYEDRQYSDQVNEKFDETDDEQAETHNENGNPLKWAGINMTSYVKNPNFYTMSTVKENVDFPGWTFERLEYSRLDENWEEWVPAEEPGNAKLTTAATENNPVVKASLNGYGSNAEYKFYQTVENLPAGIYIINMQTRTAPKNNADPDTGEKGFFNAQNDEGVWDKYIFAQVTDAAGNEVSKTMSPFWVGGYNDQGFPTGIYWVRVEDGQKLTFGAVEQYLSGKASGHDWNAELGDYVPARYWDTNTWVRNARLYFYAPLDDYDYAAAAQRMQQDIETAIETVEEAPAKQGGVLYNIAGQQVDENYKGIVVTEDGKKYLQK